MATRIDETFALQAPIDRVFRFLTDPHDVAQCLPGAELTGQTDQTTYTGRIRVKVGPITASYDGQVRMLVVDAAQHRVQLAGEGKESTGAGSARITMTATMRPLGPGATDVQVEAVLDVAGKVVTFGRGMVDNVNKQLFRQFVERVRAHVESPPADADATAGTAAAPASDVAGAAETGRVTAVPVPSPSPLRIVPIALRAIWQSIAEVVRRGRTAGRGGDAR